MKQRLDRTFPHSEHSTFHTAFHTIAVKAKWPNPSSAKTRFQASSSGTRTSMALFPHFCLRLRDRPRPSCPAAALPGPVFGIQFQLTPDPNVRASTDNQQTSQTQLKITDINYQTEVRKQGFHAQCTCTNPPSPQSAKVTVQS